MNVRLLLLIAALAWARPAWAGGITAFVQNGSPGPRAGIGFALGLPLFTEVLTLEGEYSRTRERDNAPSLVIWSGNIVLISPLEFARLRPYLASGFGVYRQNLADRSETSFATLPGFGTFLRLGGGFHGRIDYRIIRLRGQPLQTDQKRIYVGVTLRF